MFDSSLNNSAAYVAAAALYELFPGIQLLGGGPTSIGFSYSFRAAYPLPPEAEKFIEEKMRQIIREKRVIEVLEMVPFSAREYLLKEGHTARAESLEGGALVEIVRIGSFIDLSEGSHLSNTAEVAAFKLWPIQDREGEFFLTGCVASSKDLLKHFLKMLSKYPQKSHIEFGEREQLWRIVEGELVWLEPGLKRVREIVQTVREHLFPQFLEVSFPDPEKALHLRKALASQLGTPIFLAEIHEESRPPWEGEVGLLRGEGGWQIELRGIGSPKEWEGELISSLQRIGKTLIILGFEYRLLLRGSKRYSQAMDRLSKAVQGKEVELKWVGEKCAPQLSFLVEDNLERRWPVLSLDWTERGFLVKVSVERGVALLIEQALSGKQTTNGERH